jgi:ABC-type transport system involved in multi-copper enzyme maturation permease subunit
MNGRSNLATFTQLIRDTFRQAWASGIFWMMLAVTAICVLLCLSVSIAQDSVLRSRDEQTYFLPPPSPRELTPSVVAVWGATRPLDSLALVGANHKLWFSFDTNPALSKREGVETIKGQMTLAFGAVKIDMRRERTDEVRFLELILGGAVAGFLGLLLALVWTVGFLPTFLEPSAAAVLLAKPAGRGQLLLGKFVGVLTFVAFQVAFFVILTWLALGLRTQVWDMTYWWCIPLLVLHFAVFYSFSVLLAVLTRSTVACVFGSLLFWLLAWGVNYGYVMAREMSPSLSPATVFLAKAAYWVSPKPIDAGVMLFNALDAKEHFAKPPVFERLEAEQRFSPQLSILSSLMITCALLALAAYEFRATDY